MANIFNKLAEGFIKAQAKKYAKQVIVSIEAFNVDVTVDNATDVLCALVKAKTGFSVPEQADNFVDAFLIKIVDNARDNLVDYLEKKVS